ncbi:unnamed protein product [Sphenostylis stenocarpa]|uniref:Transmembrane protein n=1 Tax=Sphenostylis stenocarpa TaxID=92480 RepID=A0AA86VIJ6_9FABA|nr:unnamed protein product [Sphenostylis stenocarpa]
MHEWFGSNDLKGNCPSHSGSSTVIVNLHGDGLVLFVWCICGGAIGGGDWSCLLVVFLLGSGNATVVFPGVVSFWSAAFP